GVTFMVTRGDGWGNRSRFRHQYPRRGKIMSTVPLTSSQTVGPFFAPALLREDARRNVLTQPETFGLRIRIEGRVVDGDGVAVPDAMVEIWQANANGRYNHPADSSPAALD